MASKLTDLIDQAILKYGSILEAPENCEEFVKIREMSPHDEKPDSVEYKERAKRKLLEFAERDGEILDLIDKGYPAEMVADKMHLSVYTVRISARNYGISNFGRYLRWYAERNGIQYYSERRIELEQQKFKSKDIKQVKVLKFELPSGAHYCESKNWHIKRRKD